LSGASHSGHRGRTAHNKPQRRKADLGQLATLYEGLSGFNADTKKLGVPGNYVTTYGEVTPEGIQALSALFLRHGGAPGNYPASQRTFYDLGCGNGKVVIGMAMLHPELQGRGYEIVTDRIDQARTAVGRLKQARLAGRLRFESTSFLEPSVGLQDACWIYMSNLCFDPDTQKALAEKLEAETRPDCVVICSKELPLAAGSLWQRVATGEIVPMSWSAASAVYVYRRSASQTSW
jgi:SAM-dependent methyltransferase